VRLLRLLDIEKRVRDLARQVGAPDRLLPTFGHSEDSARLHVEVDDVGLHYVVVERGKEVERNTTPRRPSLAGLQAPHVQHGLRF
jgi:hypothetical protein